MSKMRVRIAAEQIERGCDYDIQDNWNKLPIILTNPEFIEKIDEKAGTELTTLDDIVGDRFITRGHERIQFTDDDADGVEYPLINNSFQIINNFVGELPESSIERYSTPKKRRVFAQSGYKVLVVEGIRPLTLDAPGIDRGGNAFADMLGEYGLNTTEWQRLYDTSITREGVEMTALRAGVTSNDIHADRSIYGIRSRDETTAYHVSGVFNSLLYSLLQISWFGRFRFTANDVVSNVRLESLKSAPMPRENEELADIQKRIEQTYQDESMAVDKRIETVEPLQAAREQKVCELYGLLEDGEPAVSMMEEATTWETFIKRILELEEAETPLETTTLGDF